MSNDPRPESISASAFLGAMRRRWYVVVLCAVVATAVAYARSKDDTKNKVYSATAQLLYGFTDEAAQVGITSIGTKPDPELESATIVSQLKLRVIARRTANSLGGGITQDYVANHIRTGKGDSGDAFFVTGRTSSPDASARIANAYSR